MNESKFYEIGGPRAIRREYVLSVLTGIVLAAVLGWVIFVFVKKGQFAAALWGPILFPNHDQFGAFWRFMGVGLRNTLYTVIGAAFGSYLMGLLLALGMIWAKPRWRWILIAWIEIFRGTSTIILIFTVATMLYRYGFRFPPVWYLIIAITLHASAAISEVFRAGFATLPRTQEEAAFALGMPRRRVYLEILLPQATRVMMPALISQLVLIVMDTSLGFVINFPDFLYQGEIAIQNLKNPIQVYALIAVVFILLNSGISKLVDQAADRDRSGEVRKRRARSTVT